MDIRKIFKIGFIAGGSAILINQLSKCLKKGNVDNGNFLTYNKQSGLVDASNITLVSNTNAGLMSQEMFKTTNLTASFESTPSKKSEVNEEFFDLFFDYIDNNNLYQKFIYGIAKPNNSGIFWGSGYRANGKKYGSFFVNSVTGLWRGQWIADKFSLKRIL